VIGINIFPNGELPREARTGIAYHETAQDAQVAVTIAEQASPARTLWRSDWVVFAFNGFAKEILMPSLT
jgi:hypothetical protein